MRVAYRKSFLKDLKQLKRQPVYQKVYVLAFETLPKAETIQCLSNVKALVGSVNRYRIRIGDYRIGFEVSEDEVEMLRVLHRREFYRYFP